MGDERAMPASTVGYNQLKRRIWRPSLRNILARKWFKSARPGAHRPQDAPEDGRCYPDATLRATGADHDDLQSWMV